MLPDGVHLQGQLLSLNQYQLHAPCYMKVKERKNRALRTSPSLASIATLKLWLVISHDLHWELAFWFLTRGARNFYTSLLVWGTWASLMGNPTWGHGNFHNRHWKEETALKLLMHSCENKQNPGIPWNKCHSSKTQLNSNLVFRKVSFWPFHSNPILR